MIRKFCIVDGKVDASPSPPIPDPPKSLDCASIARKIFQEIKLFNKILHLVNKTHFLSKHKGKSKKYLEKEK